MDNGYIVRFIRKDEKADEEYYYLAYGDALSHLALFKNDDSGLYKRIEIVDSCSLRLPYLRCVWKNGRSAGSALG